MMSMIQRVSTLEVWKSPIALKWLISAWEGIHFKRKRKLPEHWDSEFARQQPVASALMPAVIPLWPLWPVRVDDGWGVATGDDKRLLAAVLGLMVMAKVGGDIKSCWMTFVWSSCKAIPLLLLFPHLFAHDKRKHQGQLWAIFGEKEENTNTIWCYPPVMINSMVHYCCVSATLSRPALPWLLVNMDLPSKSDQASINHQISNNQPS